MARIIFIEPSGSRKSVEGLAGASLMRAARDNGVEGLAAECGGCLSCATCHAYIAEGWASRVPEPSEDEKIMLEGAMDVRPNSRLTCQIIITNAMDGLEVEIPASQL